MINPIHPYPSAVNKPAASRRRPGKGLTAKQAGAYMRFTLFLGVIGFAYVFNSHLADRQTREMERLQRQVKDLKANYHMRQAALLSGVRYSEIEAAADTIGLISMDRPPYQLFVQLPEPEPFVRNLKRRYTEIRLSDTTQIQQMDTLTQPADTLSAPQAIQPNSQPSNR